MECFFKNKAVFLKKTFHFVNIPYTFYISFREILVL